MASFLLACTLAMPNRLVARQTQQLPGDTLARIGESFITTRELIRRVEAMPVMDRQQPSQPEELKSKALRAIVAEKLLANQSSALGLTRDPSMETMRHQLENLFIRDELYRREVLANSNPSEDQIFEGLSRYAREKKVVSFLVPDETTGKKLVERLGLTGIDSVMKGLPSKPWTQIDTIIIHFGTPDTGFENAAYSIRKSRTSKVAYSSNFGWAVLYLLGTQTNGASAKKNPAERRHAVERILSDRLQERIAAAYYFETLKSSRATVDSLGFEILSDSISALWLEDTVKYRTKNGFILTSEMVQELLNRLRPVLGKDLVAMDGGGLKLGEVVEMLRYDDYLSKSSAGLQFKLQFNDELKRIVAQELLAREGRRQHLQNTANVRADMQTWSDYWAAGGLYIRIRDSIHVTDDEIISHLVKNKEIFGRRYEVDVCEILTDSLQDVVTILDEIRHGVSLENLASRSSKRALWSLHGGRSGFFPVVEQPLIGFHALFADTGKIVGPLKLPEGYSVFKVLGKKTINKSPAAFDSLKENVHQRLLNEKRKQTMDQYIAALAKDQRISVDEVKLKKVKITMIPTFTRRLIGFGGRMSAFPLLMPQWDWFKEYKKRTNVNF